VTAAPPPSGDALARLLIVDDEVANMRALCDTLGGAGYETSGFTSPREALGAVQPERFDLLLTDLMMPEMDGIALLQAARERDRGLVGIVMTGHGTVDTAVAAMKVGAYDYILKPFKLRAILPTLERALVVRRLGRENAELSRRVAERTAELEAANRELEAFSYSVAHDLRSPLRAINGFSHVLLEDHGAELSPTARAVLDRVLERAGHMGRLIDDLLGLARLSRTPLALRRVVMAQLAREVAEELRRDVRDRDVAVVVGDMPDAVGDQGLLRQVFVNLLANAFKFTRARERGLVEAGSLENGDEQAYFVRDNGAGFDMRYADKLFGVFQRLHAADEFEGTGVGLSIVQRIVNRHGGRVWAEAEVDRGATFYFTVGRDLRPG
jgi:signal transduction histidine kinase